MALAWQIDVQGSIVHVRVQGDATAVREGSEIMSQAARCARQAGSQRYLFDIRAIGLRSPLGDLLAYAKSARAHGFEPGARIAVLGNAGDERLAFMEALAVNRGFTARGFADEALARDWLST
jgi:hypothetical protein